jgi:hypothetical protein
MEKSMENNVIKVLKNFKIPQKLSSVKTDRTGLINDTYITVFRYKKRQTRFILQRINTLVFTKPIEVMSNIDLILRHQASKILLDTNHPDPRRGILRLVPANNGKTYYHDTSDNYWRVYHFVEGTIGFNTVESESMAYEAAKAFGRFGRYLSDIDVNSIHVTIPDFHNIVKRYDSLELSIKQDSVNRKGNCKAEISFALERKELCNIITSLTGSDQIPLRVTHNDTKINNVLMDELTMKGLCVIDLDTVMPGTILSDFGDMVRTFTPPVNEDEPDISKVTMRMNIFKAMASGYLTEANLFLTPVEKSHLVYGGKLITLMQGIRNLTDYLNGDIYYKTDYPSHNLTRSRNQFALVASIEKKEKKMQEIINAF